MLTTIRTRRVTISRTKIAQAGRQYSDRFLGLDVVWTSAWDGAQKVGVVESFGDAQSVATYGYPVIRFADGTWASGDLDLAVIVPADA